MKVLLLDEAKAQFEAEDAWWRENRDFKELFVDEFEVTLRRIADLPQVGQRYRWKGSCLIQRWLMDAPRPPTLATLRVTTHASELRKE